MSDSSTPTDPQTVDPSAIVRRAAELIRTEYLFPEVGAEIATLLEHRLAAGAYDDATDPASLDALVTADLRSVNGDRHLRLRAHQDPLPDHTDEAAVMAGFAARARDAMGGVRRVERLTGNVGLLALAPELFPTTLVGASIAAAMGLLADTAALIIDLREMRGGDPGTVALVAGYLFDEPTHLNSMVPRDAGRATQSWTAAWVPGPRFGATKPVWVLTSATTFSGGEELSYDLQQLGRATVVGEVTGGGANAREGYTLHRFLELHVPVVGARNPVSGSNWEDSGVVPDVATSAADALATAHRSALDHLAHDTSLSPALRREIAAR